MGIDAGKVAYGAALVLFAVAIAIHLARDGFRKDVAKCTETCAGAFLRMDPTTCLPLIRMFLPDRPPLEFWHGRPVWGPDGQPMAYGTGLSIRYDPSDPWKGPHVLPGEIEAHAKSVRNLSVLAAALAVTGAVLITCGIMPAA